MDHKDKALKLKQLKANLLRLSSEQRQHVALRSVVHTTARGENTTLYHIIRSRKRQEQRTIKTILQEDDTAVMTTHEIFRAFQTHYETEFAMMHADKISYPTLMGNIQHKLPAHDENALTLPITQGELYYAIQMSKKTWKRWHMLRIL
jgi:hypothetical protein